MVSSFDMAAQRFKEHKYSTVIMASYDTYRYGIPLDHYVEEVPSIIMYKAIDKEKPVKYFAKQHKTRWLMEFIEENASIKIMLTDRSHLPIRIARASDPDLITEDL